MTVKLRGLLPERRRALVAWRGARARVHGWLSGRVPFLSQPVVDPPAVYVTPLVRRTAERLGVDLTGLAGTGIAGRIRPVDVRVAAELDRPTSPSATFHRAAELMSLTTARGQQSELMLELVDDGDVRPILVQVLVITRAMLSEPNARPHATWLHRLAEASRSTASRQAS